MNYDSRKNVKRFWIGELIREDTESEELEKAKYEKVPIAACH